MNLLHAVCARLTRAPVRLVTRGKRVAGATIFGFVIGLGLWGGMAAPVQATLAPEEPQLYLPYLQTEPLSLTFTHWIGRPQSRVDGLFSLRLGEGAVHAHQSQLTHERDRHSAWSPDGQYLLVVNVTDGQYRLVRLDPDGSNRQVIYECPRLCRSPAWSPTGDRIAFSIDGSESLTTDIYLIDPDGENLRQFTTDSRSNHTPSWSPDGTMLAFDSTSEERTTAVIYVTDLEGEVLHTLAGAGTHSRHATWSPDGTRLAFSDSNDGLDGSLSITDLDGSNLTTIATASELNYVSIGNPVWSPDGRYIVFTTSIIYWSSSIAIIKPNGEGFQSIAGQALYPAWKP